jgi:hypothetical protein
MKTISSEKFRCDACRKPAAYESEVGDVDDHPDTKPMVIRGHEFTPDMTPRTVVPKIRVCERHKNFPFSDDARAFAAGTHPYDGRNVDPSESARAAQYKERV